MATQYGSCIDPNGAGLGAGPRIEKGKRKEIDFVFDNVVSAFDNEPVISQFNQILIPARPPQAADVIIRISKSASLHIME